MTALVLFLRLALAIVLLPVVVIAAALVAKDTKHFLRSRRGRPKT